jgi:hypothetical protein
MILSQDMDVIESQENKRHPNLILARTSLISRR